MIRVFVGWDRREAIAATVLQHSIQERSSELVAIVQLRRTQLPMFTRERGPLESTDFSMSRFLVPYLCGYEGWGLFLDCDMLCQDDIAKLWRLRDEQYAVQVVKHDYQPAETVKFLNQPQTNYAKKNWSSAMLFNAAKCKALTPEYVNTATGLELHQFKWIDESEIGEIPERWNHLVTGPESSTAPDSPALIHYTVGGPWFHEYQHCPYSKEWVDEYRSMAIEPLTSPERGFSNSGG